MRHMAPPRLVIAHQVMLEDIRACAQLGADGVVSGCLSPDGTVDAPHTARLLAETQAAGGARCTRY